MSPPCRAATSARRLGCPCPGWAGRSRWLVKSVGRRCTACKAAGMTVSGVARATGLDRKTVRRCLRQVRWQAYRRPARREALLDAHRAWLVERAAQVGYSARILYQELCTQRGFEGGYGTVRDAVRPLRLETAAASLTQCRFETEPGEQAQADWGEVRVLLGSQVVEVHIFVMTLGYSRRGWAEGYEHERMESLLGGARAWVRALRWRDPRDSVRPHAHRHPGRARGTQALESDLRRRSPGTGGSSRGCAGPIARRPRARWSPA